MQITLEELLKSRDERHEHQLALLKEHPGSTLVCLTVVMPGSVKRNVQSLVAGHAGLDALRERFAGETVALKERDLDTGYEVYLLTGLPPLEAKKRACEIEEQHELGRLLDIDVLDEQGVPLSRELVGRDARRCLICDGDARCCMRSHAHTLEELQTRINEMIDAYVQRI